MTRSKSALPRGLIRQVNAVGTADIVVGIPSFRAAATISNVIKVVGEGLDRHYPHLRAVIVNSDGGSTDNTRQVALETPVAPGIEKIVTSYQGLPGKGSAFHTIFEISDRLGANVCIVVDSDLRSIEPGWIKALGDPILKHGFGFVAPYYQRHKYDGTITNAIAFPLIHSLYGYTIRQPIGGEFGLSGGLAKILSHQDIWDGDVARFGIDLWLTTTAICEGFRVCQANMGVKVHDAKDPGADLEPMFRQVVGTAFRLMGKYASKWKISDNWHHVELYGEAKDVEPEPVAVNATTLIEKFIIGAKANETSFMTIIGEDNLEVLTRVISGAKQGAIEFPDRLWARIVYDHAVAYNFSDEAAGKDVIASLMTLYFGRLADFIEKTDRMGHEEVEKLIVELAETFAAEKSYLVQRWEGLIAPIEPSRDDDLSMIGAEKPSDRL